MNLTHDTITLTTPDYYNSFRCIGPKCNHNCCIGWGVDIDDNTFQLYRNTGGDFGKRLIDNMTTEDGFNTFALNGRRCPFLNKDNLCDIFINLGESALCNVCTEYPRFGTQYGSVLEKGIGFSCEEAGRIILSQTEPVQFTEKQIPGTAEETDSTMLLALLRSRKTLLQILQDRNLKTEERIEHALVYADTVQELINRNTPEYINGKYVPHTLKKHKLKDIDVFLDLFDTLEALDNEWTGALQFIRNTFDNKKKRNDALAQLKVLRKEHVYENTAVYFIYRYYLNAMYDNDARAKVRFMALCYTVIRELDAAVLYKSGLLTLADQIENRRIFCSQIEHSRESIDAVADEIMFTEELENIL